MARGTFKDLELRQLRGFVLVAMHGNFSAAARDLGVSVPAVWEQVRALERALGVSLLLHRERNMELTRDGQLLLDIVRPYVHGLDSVARLFQARREELPPQFGVVANQSLLANQLPRPLCEFTKRHPDVRLRLFGDPHSSVLVRMIEMGEADLGVLSVDWGDSHARELAHERLFDLRFMLLAQPDHPLLHKKRLAVADIVANPIMTTPTGGPSRKVLDRLLHQHDLAERAHIIVENSSTDVIRQYAALGMGIALLYVRPEPNRRGRELHMRLVDPQIEPMTVALVTRKYAPLPAHVDEFRTIVRRHLADGDGAGH